MSLKIVFISANSPDPDEVPPYVAFHSEFHPGLHSLLRYLFTGIQNEKSIYSKMLYSNVPQTK